ncbi:MAG: hypothetical protein UY76_C0004G0013 [Candidatus Uhrbacteria bacterium GW2011_GWA2_52_8d]|uniref:Uncharacterized protein n=1 Tax=Candidatus Uhrbacteria bacterium GW2011_GWA2_52_8d TaxID=1618979 RepID=A0A0G1XR24_9BACT|nr:MAG: hypothetical protein UY76_C0004G0013 [Candidatus Uhrbacteria bacterium GW2011_GWA2_52_8d]
MKRKDMIRLFWTIVGVMVIASMVLLSFSFGY